MSGRNAKLIRKAAAKLRKAYPDADTDWVRKFKRDWPRKTAKQKAFFRRLFT